MSIENSKLMNLADGKVLYDDLRGRVEAKYTKPVTGIPASDIEAGVIPDLTNLIDDTAGSGDTDVTWSADKSQTEVDSVVTISDTQPQHSGNKLWIKENEDQEYAVPTYAEFEALAGSVENKLESIDIVLATTSESFSDLACDTSVSDIIAADESGKIVKATFNVVAQGIPVISLNGTAYIMSMGFDAASPPEKTVVIEFEVAGGVSFISVQGIAVPNSDDIWEAYTVNNLSLVGTSVNNSFNAHNTKISSLGTPTQATDAATKGYVDNAIPDISRKINEPASEGTSGQVLTTDGNGGRTWTTVQGGGGGAVDDVQINGTSILSQGVANIPVASSSALGVAKVNSDYGIKLTNDILTIDNATDALVKAGGDTRKPLTPYYLDKAVYYGLSKLAGEDLKNDTVTVGTYPEKSKSAISQMLNAPVSVSGTTPSITAKAGVRYICGEVSTLTIVVPASGCIDVTFTSGSTATVLTVTPPTGMTMKWANDFDPTALNANTTYEINIMDGCLGVAGSWT